MFRFLIDMWKKYELTGQIIANNNKGAVDRAKSQCIPNVGITTKAKATSRQAPSAQKH